VDYLKWARGRSSTHKLIMHGRISAYAQWWNGCLLGLGTRRIIEHLVTLYVSANIWGILITAHWLQEQGLPSHIRFKFRQIRLFHITVSVTGRTLKERLWSFWSEAKMVTNWTGIPEVHSQSGPCEGIITRGKDKIYMTQYSRCPTYVSR
jgi:hypothetical protein